MNTKNVVFEDPQFGRIEVPQGAFPTRDEWEERKKKYRAAVKGKRLWPAGSVTRCHKCKNNSLVGSDEVTHQVVRPGNLQTFRHLRGAKCAVCGAQYLEPEDVIAVDEAVGAGVVADFEAKVSNIGSGTLGTYWPKDVVRAANLEPGRAAYIQVVDRDTVLVRFADRRGSSRRAPPRTRGAGSRKR